jgi:hypothetical protein
MLRLIEENEDRKLLTPEEEEQLVEEVLSDLPPEEKGEREEWNEQVGWHRKENIRKRRTPQLEDNNSNHYLSPSGRNQKIRELPEQEGVSSLHHGLRPPDNGPQTTPSPSTLLILVALVLVGFITSKVFHKGHKGRTL